jgi:hypothetical protein
MLTMLSTIVVAGAALILTLLCSVLILPLPEDPMRDFVEHGQTTRVHRRVSGIGG